MRQSDRLGTLQMRVAGHHNIEMLFGKIEHGERLEAEKVELYQPGELDPFHVELRDRDVGARVAIEGHELGQWPVADHHPRGMRRGVPV